MSKFSPDFPLKLADLPPVKDVESREILKKAILAHRALTKLVARTHLLPDPGNLMRGMVLPEIRKSLLMDGLIFTQEEFYGSFFSDRHIPNLQLRQAIAFQEALLQGFHQARENRELDAELIIRCGRKLSPDNSIREEKGAVTNSEGKLLFTPPEGKELINQKLENLGEFASDSTAETEDLVRMAVAAYQFQALQPFGEGNGRLGRMFILLFLGFHNLLEWPVFYVSQQLAANSEVYYRVLNRVMEDNKWKPWIFFMLDMVEKAAVYTDEKIRLVLELIKEEGELIKGSAPEIYSEYLVRILFSQLYCKRRFLEDAGLVKKKTAGVYLGRLEKIGILKVVRVGKEKLYVHEALLNILEN